MNLPTAPAAYDQTDQAKLREEMRRADGLNLKRGGNIEFINNQLVMRSPNGSRWLITVSNAGALGTSAL